MKIIAVVACVGFLVMWAISAYRMDLTEMWMFTSFYWMTLSFIPDKEK